MKSTGKGTLLQHTPVQLPIVHVVDCCSRIFAVFELDKAEPSVLFCSEVASSKQLRLQDDAERMAGHTCALVDRNIDIYNVACRPHNSPRR